MEGAIHCVLSSRLSVESSVEKSKGRSDCRGQAVCRAEVSRGVESVEGGEDRGVMSRGKERSNVDLLSTGPQPCGDRPKAVSCHP